MSQQQPPPNRPKPTPKRKPPNDKAPLPTLQGASNPLGQSGDTGRCRTRRTTAMMAQEQRQTVDFVSGGTTENNDSGSISIPDRPATTGPPQMDGSRPNRPISKGMGRKKASVPSKKNNMESANAPAPPSHAPAPNEIRKPPTKSIQRVATREHFNNGIDDLDQAPYRFEGGEQPEGNQLPEPPQPTLPPTNPTTPVLPPLPSVTLPEGFRDIQQPDAGNLYDRLRYSEELSTRLLQQYLIQQPPRHEPTPQPQPSTSGPVKMSTKGVKKTHNPANSTSIHHHPQPKPTKPSQPPKPKPAELSQISKPHRTDHTPLDLAMGLKNRFNIYIRIRDRVRKIFLSTGIDWSRRWPEVPPRDKAMLYEMVRDQVPYMARFKEDWATEKIASQYAAYLRSQARSRGELEPDPRYAYLKDNSAKRRKNAPRGVRPGIAKAQDQTGTNSSMGQDPGPSGAGSLEPNINTASDEDMMGTSGLYGSRHPSDNEDESDLDDDPDFEGRN